MADLAARIGAPVLIGAAVGGIAMYVAVDLACKSFKDNPWIAAAVGALAGGGAGYAVSRALFSL